MKASELAFGDWVMPLRKSIKKPCQVVSIDRGTNTCWIDSDEYSGLLSCSDVERIPLTPEILEKNGFKKEGSWFIIEDDYYDVSIREITDSIWRVKYCNTEFSAFVSVLHIAFIHELQHALRLCGIEKEIVI